MDSAYIEKNNLVERYLLDQLSEEQRASFEQAFLGNQELLDEIDRAEALLSALKRNQSALHRELPRQKPVFFQWLETAWVASTSTAVAIIAVGYSMWLTTTMEDGTNAVTATPLRYLKLDSVRGSTAESKVEADVPIILQFDVGAYTTINRFAVQISSETGVVAEVHNLAADGDDYLRVGLLSLSAGSYEAVLSTDENQPKLVWQGNLLVTP
ncbi:MAG: hypothetical protein AAF662_03400 [Pseudomonadota bacterium]